MVDDKKKEFYKQLFAKTEGEQELPKKKKNKKKKAIKEGQEKVITEEVKEDENEEIEE